MTRFTIALGISNILVHCTDSLSSSLSISHTALKYAFHEASG